MPVTWTHYHGLPDYSYLDSLVAALGNGGANYVSATSTAATFISGAHKVILSGQLVIGATGEPDSGLIDTIEIYEGAILVAKGTGYQITVDALGAAFDEGKNSALGSLFFGPPSVTYGSDDADELFSSPFDDRVFGNKGDDKIVGREGDDELFGGAGNDHLVGFDGRDLVKGGKGHDEIGGGKGNDILFGGKGRDTFSFYDPLDALSNVDKVKKFSSAKDTIELNDAYFSGPELGVLKGKYFRDGKKAKDGDDHILYNDGRLFYDADGDGAVAKVLFAKIKGDPKLDADDFLVI